jgi:3-carboxy-cis,cis-muconate cycloisomerase
MRQNLDLTNGLVVSEAVMMGLAPYLGREYAHDLVYDLCRDALKQDKPLLELLASNAEITKHVDRKKLAEFCDPSNYLGLSGVMVDRVLARRIA